VPWIYRHAVAVVAVAVALVGTAGVFVFAKPTYQPAVTSKTVDMTTQDHYTIAEVRPAFAAQGIVLIRRSGAGGTTYFSDKHPGVAGDSLLVTIFDPHAKVGFCTVCAAIPYEQRLGNLLVSYGGRDAGLLSKVRAAVAAVKH